MKEDGALRDLSWKVSYDDAQFDDDVLHLALSNGKISGATANAAVGDERRKPTVNCGTQEGILELFFSQILWFA